MLNGGGSGDTGYYAGIKRSDGTLSDMITSDRVPDVSVDTNWLDASLSGTDSTARPIVYSVLLNTSTNSRTGHIYLKYNNNLVPGYITINQEKGYLTWSLSTHHNYVYDVVYTIGRGDIDCIESDYIQYYINSYVLSYNNINIINWPYINFGIFPEITINYYKPISYKYNVFGKKENYNLDIVSETIKLRNYKLTGKLSDDLGTIIYKEERYVSNYENLQYRYGYYKVVNPPLNLNGFAIIINEQDYSQPTCMYQEKEPIISDNYVSWYYNFIIKIINITVNYEFVTYDTSLNKSMYNAIVSFDIIFMFGRTVNDCSNNINFDIVLDNIFVDIRKENSLSYNKRKVYFDNDEMITTKAIHKNVTEYKLNTFNKIETIKGYCKIENIEQFSLKDYQLLVYIIYNCIENCSDEYVNTINYKHINFDSNKIPY